ncbi:Ankyrin repeat domain-containing protein 44 [Chamberlinius hualienensis]
MADWLKRESYIDVLLFNNCNKYAIDIFGRTALHYGVSNGYVAEIRRLINETHKFDIETFLRQPLEILKKSLCNKYVVFVNQIDCFGQSALHVLAERFNGEYFAFQFGNDDFPFISQLVISGTEIVDLLQPTKFDFYVKTFEHLFSKYPHFLLKNLWKYFKEAINFYPKDLIEYLYTNYPQWLKIKNGFTTLHLASAKGHLGIVKFLLSKGVDPMVEDDFHRNSIDYAYFNDQTDVFEYFVTKFNASSTLKNEFIIKMIEFLKSESDVNAVLDENDTSLLHLACKLHKTSFVKFLIDRGADVNLKDKLGRTPLHYSAFNQNKCNMYKCKTVQHLLTSAATYNLLDSTGKTPLDIMEDNQFKPCRSQNSACDYIEFNCCDALVKMSELFSLVTKDISYSVLKEKLFFILNVLHPTENDGNIFYFEKKTLDDFVRFETSNNGLDDVVRSCVNVVNDNGDSLLHLAVKHGHAEFSTLLLNHGANPYKMNKQNVCPLEIAMCKQNNIWMKFYLIKNMFDQINEDLLLKYISQNVNCISIIFNARNVDGGSLLHFAANNGWLKLSQFPFVQYYLISLDIDAIDNMNRSPLHYAALNRNDEIVGLLLNHGCCYNLKDLNGKTPLDLCNNTSKVLILVNSAFDVIQSDNPLNIIDLVNESEFNKTHFKFAVNTFDRKGKSLSNYSCEINDKQIIKLLLFHGAPIETFIETYVDQENISYNILIKVLFNWKCDIFNLNSDSNKFSIISKACNFKGETLLHFTDKLPIKLIKKLIENGADVNAVDNYRNTPLLNATRCNNLNVVELLIENGAEINVKNLASETVVINGMHWQYFPITFHLLSKGADVNAANFYGFTPLMLADSDIDVSKLIEYGAEVNAKNLYGETALVYAICRGRYTNAKILLEHGADINVKSKDNKSLLQLVSVANCDGPKLRDLLLNHGAE